jgi:hypothetical protein
MVVDPFSRDILIVVLVRTVQVVTIGNLGPIVVFLTIALERLEERPGGLVEGDPGLAMGALDFAARLVVERLGLPGQALELGLVDLEAQFRFPRYQLLHPELEVLAKALPAARGIAGKDLPASEMAQRQGTVLGVELGVEDLGGDVWRAGQVEDVQGIRCAIDLGVPGQDRDRVKSEGRLDLLRVEEALGVEVVDHLAEHRCQVRASLRELMHLIATPGVSAFVHLFARGIEAAAPPPEPVWLDVGFLAFGPRLAKALDAIVHNRRPRGLVGHVPPDGTHRPVNRMKLGAPLGRGLGLPRQGKGAGREAVPGGGHARTPPALRCDRPAALAAVLAGPLGAFLAFCVGETHGGRLRVA